MTQDNLVISGIYAIINTITGERYIGQSKNIYRRWYEHRMELKSGRHIAKRLQQDWNELGESTFSFVILEEIQIDKLDEVEEKYLTDRFQRLGSYEYNSAPAPLSRQRQKRKEKEELTEYAKTLILSSIGTQLDTIAVSPVSIEKLIKLAGIASSSCISQLRISGKYGISEIDSWAEYYRILFALKAYQQGCVIGLY